MELIEAIQELMDENREPNWAFKAVKDSHGQIYELNLKVTITAGELIQIARALDPQLGLFKAD